MIRDEVFDECTRTIVKQVEDLKTLVNEFSTFAPPAGSHGEALNDLVRGARAVRQGHRRSIRRSHRSEGPASCSTARASRALINMSTTRWRPAVTDIGAAA